MVWCISLCAGNVEVDLLYSENSTIGQKITLTEKIVKVLPEIKCPYSLEPHQIQGLDAFHIHPVIVWLVKEAGYVRERLGDETLNFAVYQFEQQGWTLGNELNEICGSGVLPLVKKSRKVYKRVIRMQYPTETNLKTKIDSEISKKFSEDEQINKELEEEDLLIIQETDEKSGITYLSERGEQMIDNKYQNDSRREETKGDMEEEFKKLELEENCVNSQIEVAEMLLVKLQNELKIIEEQNISEEIQSKPKEIFEEMKTLLSERDELKAVERSFKFQCREELSKLEQKIEKIEENNKNEESLNEENKNERNFKENKGEILNLEIASLNKEIAKLARQVGAKPSQAEMAQYQRRFVELCNQMVSKHHETKRQYTQYNTLVDVRTFMRQEIDLLDSIDRQRDLFVYLFFGTI
uniref:Coiled-coil domain-containing protein 93 n=1 Tax=Meloidogyne incognita TaxID=6306 RepID=A0A914KGH1_MELIC